MAKFDLKFLDSQIQTDFIKVEMYECPDDGSQSIYIEGFDSSSGGCDFIINLDKSTAIKFAKTLRTEINKIEE